ncbi:MAG: PD-(D/E)XK nuclease family protein [Pleurocapsa sp.]
MTNLIHLSQAHLNLLEICPPRFQQVYLNGLSSLPHPEQQESIAWGSRFHQIMQQRELGLPIESLLAADRELASSITALLQAAPDVLNSDRPVWREAEHCRTHVIRDFLLTVVYDLIIAEEQTAKIFDWKTYRQPKNRAKLAKNWQTRLYLYVLAETSVYSPQQISMTYWFVKSDNPQSLTFPYNDELHAQTEKDLTHLLNNLEQWLEAESLADVPFPHRANCENTCPFYQSFEAIASTDKVSTTGNPPQADWLTSIAQIEEISI